MKATKSKIKKTDSFENLITDINIESETTLILINQLGDRWQQGEDTGYDMFMYHKIEPLRQSLELFKIINGRITSEIETVNNTGIGKSKSPSLSKTYKIKGHEGTFKAIAKSKEFTLMQSVELGNKAYNVILKNNKIYADKVDGVKDKKWQSIR